MSSPPSTLTGSGRGHVHGILGRPVPGPKWIVHSNSQLTSVCLDKATELSTRVKFALTQIRQVQKILMQFKAFFPFNI